MKKALHLLLAATLLFSCSKKDTTNADPVYTYSQILDNLPITIGKKYVVAYYVSGGNYQKLKDTVTFLADSWVNEKTESGDVSYKINAYAKRDQVSPTINGLPHWVGKLYVVSDTFTIGSSKNRFYYSAKDSIRISFVPNQPELNLSFGSQNYYLLDL